ALASPLAPHSFPTRRSSDLLDFSFSGLKTAVLTKVRALEKMHGALSQQHLADLAAATELAIVDVLASKSLKAVKQAGVRRLVVAGGVGANRLLRERLRTEIARMR